MTRGELGAWLVRCNPMRTDLTGFDAPIRSWCVADNYRSRLIRCDDLIFLWVSGSHPRFVRGIWGSGRVTEPVHDNGDGLRIGLEVPLRPEPLITDAELRGVGVDDLEVQRMPQGSNPSWVSRAQLLRIEARR